MGVRGYDGGVGIRGGSWESGYIGEGNMCVWVGKGEGGEEGVRCWW